MVVTNSEDKFLDKAGVQHLIDELKAYCDEGGGTVDLSDYYTKEQIDVMLQNITPTGGKSINTCSLVDYCLVITYTDGTSENLGNIRGESGSPGINGTDGKDGINGTDGTDGTSPVIEVNTNTDTEYTLSITDTNGTITTPNLKGADGTSGGGGGSSNDYVLDTETEIGTYMGKPMYRKMIILESITLNSHTVAVSVIGTGINIVNIGGWLCTAYSEWVPLSYFESTSFYASAILTDYNCNIKILSKVNASHGSAWAYGYLIVEYTKN